MTLSVHVILILLALLFCVLAMCGKVPLWIAVLLIILDMLIGALGYGRTG